MNEKDVLYIYRDLYKALEIYKEEINKFTYVLFWGTGHDSNICYKYLYETIDENAQVIFLDNDINKHGKLIYDKYECCGVEKLSCIPLDKTVIVIATSMYAQEVHDELLGILNDRELRAPPRIWRYFVGIACRIEENISNSNHYIGFRDGYRSIEKNKIEYLSVIKAFDEKYSSAIIVDEEGKYSGLIACKAMNYIRDYDLVKQMYLCKNICLDYVNDSEFLKIQAKDIFAKTFIDEIPVIYKGFVRFVISRYATWAESKSHQRLKWDFINRDLFSSVFRRGYKIICSSNSANMIDFSKFFGEDVLFCNSDKKLGTFDLHLFEEIATVNAKNIYNLSDLYANLLFKTVYRWLKINGVNLICVDTDDSKDFPFDDKRCMPNNQYEIFEKSGVWQALSIGVNVKLHRDFNSKALNVMGGQRYTPGAPDNSCRTVYFFGACTAFGSYACDSETIEAFLQDSFNKYKYNRERVRVINCSHGSNTPGINDLINALYILINSQFKSGDIVVLMKVGVPKDIVNEYVSLAEIFNQQNTKDVVCFVDSYRHCNATGNRIIADYLYRYIVNVMKCSRFDGYVIPSLCKKDDNSELMIEWMNEYLYKLDEEKMEGYKNVGAIVMNCNPFTCGHAYLIEEARKQTDYLYVFIVEEDKSFFKFKDRLSMVKDYCAGYDDVKVLPSGKLMISSITFAEYFNKENLQDEVVIPTRDVRIFGSVVAPRLDITKRFVGTEPFDIVTRQYNETMKELLPEYGCSIVEIPRKEYDNEAVSATKVREFLSSGRLDECRKYVPNTTWKYLLRV